MVSRILGFIRDLVLARVFGADAASDAFFVAFKIPNFFRRLFGEGAFATAFIPVLTEYKETKTHSDLQQLVNHVAGTLGLILLIFTALGMLAAPLVISLFAFGWVVDGEDAKITLAADMLVLTFPYLLFISLTAFAGGILNAHNRFAVPAFTPVLLNLILIGSALWLAPQMATPIMALAWGVLVAGITQFVFQLPFLKGLDLLPSFRPAPRDPGVRRILWLMLPALFAVSVTQINLLLDTVLASFLQTGSISWLYFSDRLMEFPQGILGVALATVMLPALSKNHAKGDTQAFSALLGWGVRMNMVFGIPAAVGLIALALPVISTLFQSSMFDATDVQMASLSLMAYAVGLFGFISIKVLAPGYFARQDTRTPVRIGVIAMAANMVFNLILIFPLQHTGLALATSLSAYLNAWLLYRGLEKQGVYQFGDSFTLLMKVGLASLFMVAAIWLLSPLDGVWLNMPLSDKVWQLLLAIIAGALVYFVSLYALGLRRSDFSMKLK